MRWLNYHHLLYFWTIARLGSVTAACRELRLAQPTVSAQLKSLEDVLGEQLFHREGRSLRLTEAGNLVFRYAEEIFGLGREMMEVLDGKQVEGAGVLRIGISDVLPKAIAHELIDTVFDYQPTPKLICEEDSPDRLVAQLAAHELDVVLSDAPLAPDMRVKAYNHLIGECGVSLLASKRLLKQSKRRFPACLNELPLLLPTASAALRRELNQWADREGLTPRVAMEFQDSALMKLFGRDGRGVFAVPTVMEEEICAEFGVDLVGRPADVRERFYLISLERKLKHPVLAHMREAARGVFQRSNRRTSGKRK